MRERTPDGLGCGTPGPSGAFGSALRRRITDQDVGPIDLDDPRADTLDARERIGRLELAVLRSVLDDRLRERRADALQLGGERRGVGGVDVHRTGERTERRETAQGE